MAQFLSQIIWCGQHEGLEFVDRSRASPNDPSTRHGVHTQGFSVSVMSTRLMEAVATECFAGGSNGIEFVRLRAVLACFLAWPIEFGHPLADTSERSGEPAAVARSPLESSRTFTRDGELFGPADGFVVAGCVG